MTRHTIDIDRELLLECQLALGTPTLSETVREALRGLVKAAEFRKNTQKPNPPDATEP